MQLYENLIAFAAQNNWHDIYNLCYVKSKETQFQKEICDALQLIYNVLPIVTIQREAIVENKDNLYISAEGKLVHNIIIPYMDKAEYADQLWDLISQMKTKSIPVKESYKQWSMVSPHNRVSLQHIYEHFLKGKNILDFCNCINNGDDAFLWLNQL